MRVTTLTLLAVLAAPAARPCTTVCLASGGEVLLGKNYDWNIGDGMLVVNKRGMQKVSLASVNPARWTSRYGSVTFNQYGREFPSGGMNEAGVVVELMMLDGSVYPADTALPATGCLDFIQYQLDTAATVEDVTANAAALRIQCRTPLHYLACDARGQCATLEYLDGRLVAHQGAALPLTALTNNTYADSLSYAQRFAGLGGNAPLPTGPGSLQRFAQASAGSRAFVPRSASADATYAFGLMERVSQGAFTQWTIVYDLPRREIAFVTREARTVRRVSLGSLEFSCASPVLVLDLQAPLEGDVIPRMVPYTDALNRNLVERAYNGTSFLAQAPESDRQAVAMHPASMTCAP